MNFKFIVSFFLFIFINDKKNFYANAASRPITDWKLVRAFGMGNTSGATFNDERAVFSNPAGVNSFQKPKTQLIDGFSFLDLQFGGNTQMFSQMNLNPLTWSETLINSAQQTPNSPSFLEIQTFPRVIIHTNSAFTILIGIAFRSVNQVVNLETSPQVAFSSLSTTSGIITWAGSYKKGRIQYGITLRPNYRINFEQPFYNTQEGISTENVVQQIRNNATRTIAVAADAGLMITAAQQWFPTIGIAARNLPTSCTNLYTNPYTQKRRSMCGTPRQEIFKTSQNRFNESILDPTELKLSFSITPRGKIGKTKVNMRLAAEATPLPLEINGQNYGIDETPLETLIHAGAELYFGDFFLQKSLKLRTGIMNGKPTWGLTLPLGIFEIEYASYFERDSLPQNDHMIFSERRHLLGLTCSW